MLGRIRCAVLAASLVVLTASRALAGSVTVQINPATGSTFASDMGISLSALETQIKGEIEKAFALAEPQKYLGGLADAQAFTLKGLGVDYASNPTKFVAGAAGSIAVSFGDTGFEVENVDRPVEGLAPNVAVMAGVNLGFAGIERLTLMGNFFTYEITMDRMTYSLRNAGLHAQIKFYRPSGDAWQLLWQWGGFDVTTGLEYSYLGLGLTDQLTTDLTLQGTSGAIKGKLVSTGSFQVDSTAFTVPIEVSTNMRLLYVLTLFAGAGLDLQLGGNTMTIGLDGALSARDPQDGSNVDLGTGRVDVTEDGSPTTAMPRVFGGAQINISVVKAFAQANVMADKGFSVAFGVRVAW